MSGHTDGIASIEYDEDIGISELADVKLPFYARAAYISLVWRAEAASCCWLRWNGALRKNGAVSSVRSRRWCRPEEIVAFDDFVSRAARAAMTQTGKLLVAVLTMIFPSPDWAADSNVMHLGVTTVADKTVIAGKPGSDFKDCENGCPVMVLLPPGKFIMGSREDDSDLDTSRHPLHEVTIAKSFAVSRFEVTFENWDACVQAAACRGVADSWGRGKMPVINVSWRDAKQYVVWLSRSTGKEYRLLTEAEWEYAVRANTATRYSWGSDAGKGNANCDGCGSSWDLQQTAPVGSFKPNAFGLYDMHGNVWEWVEDVWHANYRGAPTDGSPWLEEGDPSFRVVRGGSWRNEADLIGAAVRAQRNINVAFDTLGFRVARSSNH